MYGRILMSYHSEVENYRTSACDKKLTIWNEMKIIVVTPLLSIFFFSLLMKHNIHPTSYNWLYTLVLLLGRLSDNVRSAYPTCSGLKSVKNILLLFAWFDNSEKTKRNISFLQNSAESIRARGRTLTSAVTWLNLCNKKLPTALAILGFSNGGCPNGESKTGFCSDETHFFNSFKFIHEF